MEDKATTLLRSVKGEEAEQEFVRGLISCPTLQGPRRAMRNLFCLLIVAVAANANPLLLGGGGGGAAGGGGGGSFPFVVSVIENEGIVPELNKM